MENRIPLVLTKNEQLRALYPYLYEGLFFLVGVASANTNSANQVKWRKFLGGLWDCCKSLWASHLILCPLNNV